MSNHDFVTGASAVITSQVFKSGFRTRKIVFLTWNEFKFIPPEVFFLHQGRQGVKTAYKPQLRPQPLKYRLAIERILKTYQKQKKLKFLSKNPGKLFLEINKA